MLYSALRLTFFKKNTNGISCRSTNNTLRLTNHATAILFSLTHHCWWYSQRMTLMLFNCNVLMKASRLIVLTRQTGQNEPQACLHRHPILIAVPYRKIAGTSLCLAPSPSSSPHINKSFRYCLSYSISLGINIQLPVDVLDVRF
jgi:hypothetical protein